jgi:hypothetical protein
VVLEKLNSFTEEGAYYVTTKHVKKYELEEDFENPPF